MRLGEWRRSIIILLLLATFLGSSAAPLIGYGGQASAAQPPVPDSEGRIASDHVVNIGLWLINVYAFDYRAGSYTFDFYIYFFWTDKNITTIDWYLMNGLPSDSSTKAIVDSGIRDDFNYQLWRVRADLFAPIEPRDYPFDKVILPIDIELLKHGYDTSLNWMTEQSGVDPGFKIVGWEVGSVDYTTRVHQYPLNMSSPGAAMALTLQRSTFEAFMQNILPPLLLCIVSAFCFLLRLDDDSTFALRAGINTAMLITAVLFNISVTAYIPPIAGLNLYETFITAVLTFLSLALIVTVLGYVEWKYTGREERLTQINSWGAVISVLLPLLLFLSFILTNG
jgi:hypothetical protein